MEYSKDLSIIVPLLNEEESLPEASGVDQKRDERQWL